MPNQIAMETPRLILRAAEAGDVRALHQTFRDPQVMQYWSEPPHTSMTRTQEWVSSMMNSGQNGITDFIICLNTAGLEDRAIGKIGVYCSRPSNEIGFLLDRQHWGKGLATEALSTMLEYLFTLKRNVEEQEDKPDTDLDQHTSLSATERNDEWLYPSITADVDPRNEASICLLKKVGFEEGELVQACFQCGNELVDSLYLRLQREDWLSGQRNARAPTRSTP